MKICFLLLVGLLSFNVTAGGLNKKRLLSMSDSKLFNAGLAKKVGKCVIADARKCEKCACDYYVKSSKLGLDGGGLPHGMGTGCVVAPVLSKSMATCWSAPNVYDQYNESKTPVCTDDHVTNAANMLRIGIKRGLCDG